MKMDQRIAHWVSRAIAGTIFHLVFRVRIVGKQRLPVSPTTGAIFASNHGNSQLVSALLPAVFWWWPLRMLAKQSLWNPIKIKSGKRVFTSKASTWYFTKVAQIPTRGDSSEESLATAIKWVQGGGKTGWFPEGGRTNGRAIYRGRTGMARVAFATGASVFPVSVTGLENIKWKQPWTWPFTRITITIGGALSASGTNPTSEQLVAFTECIMHAIASQADLQYIDEYYKKPLIRPVA